MTSSYSDALRGLTGPHMAWAIEQILLCETLLPQSPTRVDPDEGVAVLSGAALRTHALAVVPAGQEVWRWAWDTDGISGRPAARRSAELRTLGERSGAPELSRPVVDLRGFEDRGIAVTTLGAMALGLLDARGVTRAVLPDGTLIVLLVDDPAVPRALPRTERLTEALCSAGKLVEGVGRDAAAGWLIRHGAVPDQKRRRLSGVLANGDEVTIRLDRRGVEEVRIAGRDGGPARADTEPEQSLQVRSDGAAPPPADSGATARVEGGATAPAEGGSARTDAAATPPADGGSALAPDVLDVVVRELAPSLRGTAAMVAHAREKLGFTGRPPTWDADARLMRFPGGDLAARPLGTFDRESDVFTWGPDTEDVRSRLREAAGLSGGRSVPELTGEPLDLSGHRGPEHAAAALARTAASAAGHVFSSLGTQFLLLTDEALVPPETDPDAAAQEIMNAVNWLAGLVPRDHLPAATRAMAESYFERVGMQVTRYGMPDFLSGLMGLYEVRLTLAEDGTVVDAEAGLAMAPRL